MLMIFILSGFLDFLSIPVIFQIKISDLYNLSEIYDTNIPQSKYFKSFWLSLHIDFSVNKCFTTEDEFFFFMFPVVS